MHPLEKTDFLCYPSKQVSKALLGKKHTSDVCLTTNKNVKMLFLSHPKSQIMWFHSFRVNWPHLEQPQLSFLPLHWEMLRVFHKGDPVPAGQSISGHIPKAVFTHSLLSSQTFQSCEQDNGFIVQVISFTCTHPKSQEGALSPSYRWNLFGRIKEPAADILDRQSRKGDIKHFSYSSESSVFT